MNMQRARAAKIVAYLKRAYPKPKTELKYAHAFQLAVSVILSAQCTDKVVNRVTDLLYKKYKTVGDFASAKQLTFQKEVSAIPFFRNKTRAIIAAARIIEREFVGKIPRTAEELQRLPGVGYKTAHVILGELYNIWEGIPTDTHVKRFAYRFGLSKHTDLKKISHDLEALVPKKKLEVR